jgi:hypothetical protein
MTHVSHSTTGWLVLEKEIEQLLAFQGLFSTVLVNYSPYQDNAYIANFAATQTKCAVKHNTFILNKNVAHVLMHHGHQHANSASVRAH